VHNRELLLRWVAGENIHVMEPDSECCPDFACCQSRNYFSPTMRARFLRAIDEKDTNTVMLMTYMAIQGLYASQGVNMRIVGEESGNA